MEQAVPARYGRKLPDGRIECVLCPRHCRLAEGQRGFCFVRACEKGRIVLTTYGRSSGFGIDPVEKKPLFHFLPGTSILSFGTAGCNLGCLFCQNWNISKSRETDTLAVRASPAGIARAAKNAGCRSVAFTYNDPVIFHEYAVDAAKECRKLGIKTAAVTAGYVCAEPRKEFYEWMDAANVDLKGFSEDFYKKYCRASLAPVLETLEYIRRETKTWLEITTLLIPGLNDSAAEIDSLTKRIAETLGPDVPLHFTAFHPDYRITDVPPTSPAILRKARETAITNGIRYCYTGNVSDPEGESTFCHACGKKLIGRNWYKLTEWNLRDGKCGFCGTPCAGIFECRPVRL
ncbi:MAG: Pyruvate formate-lyase 1-activating enzyme [Candidatus Omnitrophica bacterium ADurb.Bin277]|nr:MAG: Pyruvate formate-lyase 1-activating enzyme [Candidatus Omnitrophica bacterium ADurb.Bin277]